jgi:hypothetical protein
MDGCMENIHTYRYIDGHMDRYINARQAHMHTYVIKVHRWVY